MMIGTRNLPKKKEIFPVYNKEFLIKLVGLCVLSAVFLSVLLAPATVWAQMPDGAGEDRLLLDVEYGFEDSVMVVGRVDSIRRIIHFQSDTMEYREEDFVQGYYLYRGLSATGAARLDDELYPCYLAPFLINESDKTIEVLSANGQWLKCALDEYGQAIVYVHYYDGKDWIRRLSLISIKYLHIRSDQSGSVVNPLESEGYSSEHVDTLLARIDELEVENRILASTNDEIRKQMVDLVASISKEQEDPNENVVLRIRGLVIPIFVTALVVGLLVVLSVFVKRKLRKKNDDDPQQPTALPNKDYPISANSGRNDDDEIKKKISRLGSATKRASGSRDEETTSVECGGNIEEKHLENIEDKNLECIALRLANNITNYLNERKKCTEAGFDVFSLSIISNGKVMMDNLRSDSKIVLLKTDSIDSAYIVCVKNALRKDTLIKFYNFDPSYKNFSYKHLAMIPIRDISNNEFDISKVIKGSLLPKG